MLSAGIRALDRAWQLIENFADRFHVKLKDPGSFDRELSRICSDPQVIADFAFDVTRELGLRKPLELTPNTRVRTFLAQVIQYIPSNSPDPNDRELDAVEADLVEQLGG